MCKKMHMIGLQDSGESGEKVQDDSTTTKHTVSQKNTGWYYIKKPKYHPNQWIL